MNILTLKHQKCKNYYYVFFLNSLRECCLLLCLKAFRPVEVLTSWLNCSEVRDQHKTRLFVEQLFFDEERLIFGVMNTCELH